MMMKSLHFGGRILRRERNLSSTAPKAPEKNNNGLLAVFAFGAITTYFGFDIARRMTNDPKFETTVKEEYPEFIVTSILYPLVDMIKSFDKDKKEFKGSIIVQKGDTSSVDKVPTTKAASIAAPASVNSTTKTAASADLTPVADATPKPVKKRELRETLANSKAKSKQERKQAHADYKKGVSMIGYEPEDGKNDKQVMVQSSLLFAGSVLVYFITMK